MDIKRILTDYESAKRQKDAAEQQKSEAERQNAEAERMRRQLNAGRIEKHLREVVAPVLDDARTEILAGGYKCSVESVSIRDPMFPASEQMFALRLKLTTGRDDAKEPAWLEYVGDFDSVTLSRVEKVGTGRAIRIINDIENPDDRHPLSEFGADNVGKQVEAFCRAVFEV